jgi:D-cysteine desulfhydrase family pyridoxal phosphate-dependent enzyme
MTEITLPRHQIAHLPTPIQPMPRLTGELGGPRLWIKRDDLTGLAFGGNKTRKLEFLLAEAQAQGAKTLITRGAVQSNHCRQTAAAAAQAGFTCILVLTGREPDVTNGNLLLDRLLGVEFVWTEDEDPDTVLKETFDQAWSDGRRPYLIPYGGSNALGAASYTAAIEELLSQGIEIDRIVFATSSGGTQAGLMVGARIFNYSGKVTGISVDPTAETLKPHVAALANEVGSLLQHPVDFGSQDVEVHDAYLGGGYSVMGDLEKGAIDLFARMEGIMLDPVYTGRAAGGMIDLIRKGEIGADERVLFWHTGGTPALFAYAHKLS